MLLDIERFAVRYTLEIWDCTSKGVVCIYETWVGCVWRCGHRYIRATNLTANFGM